MGELGPDRKVKIGQELAQRKHLGLQRLLQRDREGRAYFAALRLEAPARRDL